MHEDGIDDLSSYSREERNDSDVVRAEDTGMGTAAGGRKLCLCQPHDLKVLQTHLRSACAMLHEGYSRRLNHTVRARNHLDDADGAARRTHSSSKPHHVVELATVVMSRCPAAKSFSRLGGLRS